MADPVQEFIDRQNSEAAARPSPLKRPASKHEPEVPGEDAVARHIRLSNARAAGQPNPLAKMESSPVSWLPIDWGYGV